MPDAPQWLIFLASQQDYGWFLGVVLWVVVAIGAARLPQTPPGIRHLLIWLGWSLAAYCFLELAATAWSEKPPHEGLDALLGGLLALGYTGMIWPRVLPGASRGRRLFALGLPLLGLVLLRVKDPLYGGLPWTFLGTLGCVAVAGIAPTARPPEEKPGGALRAMAAFLLASLLVSPLGPLAYALIAGRQDVDLNPLAIPHLLALLGAACGALVCLWGTSIAGREEWRRALRAAWWALLVWVGAGFVLIVWMGARVREQHNARLSRQAENAAALLDRTALREGLTEEFRIRRTLTFYQPVGWEVIMGYIPEAARGPFKRLNAQLYEIDQVNPEADFIHLLAVRQGWLVAAAIHVKNQRSPYLVSLPRRANAEDLVMLQSRETTVIGPEAGAWGTIVSVRVPLFVPGEKYALGWLVAQYRAAVWQAEQAVDRFVIMGLVALGIVLWGLAVAYRLRNIEREVALRHASNATEADRVKTLFLAKVSHELRTPLQTILGNAELAWRAGPAPELAARIGAIRSQGALLQRLVNDLLDLSALQVGRFQLQPAVFDLRTLTRECLGALAGPAREKGLALQEKCPDEAPLQLLGDAQRIRQVLMNLLGNAVKYTARGAVVLAVETRQTAAETWRVRLEVQDTGPGISPSDQRRIFEPFTRLEQHRHLAEGTGLGLSLVAGLVRAMGGEIQMESDGISGTRVWCELSLPAGRTTEEVPSATFRPARVLVADDNTLVRELLASSLTAAGFTITTVADGEAALAAFEAAAFDAVVLDISMPRLDGIETARAIRRRKQTTPGPWIIGLSAHAQEADIALAKVAGMDRFLVKPVELVVLNEVLAEGLDQAKRAGFSSPGATDSARELARRLRETFDAEWPALGERLRTALAKENWNDFRQAVHYLKNSADVLGSDTLRLACMEAEHGASLEDARQIGPIWLRIEKIVAQYQSGPPPLSAVIPTADSNPTQ